MAISSFQTTLIDGASAVAIVTAGLVRRRVKIVKLTNATEVYLGAVGVSPTNGLKLDGMYMDLTVDVGDVLYAVVLTGYGNETISAYVSSAL